MKKIALFSVVLIIFSFPVFAASEPECLYTPVDIIVAHKEMTLSKRWNSLSDEERRSSVKMYKGLIDKFEHLYEVGIEPNFELYAAAAAFNMGFRPTEKGFQTMLPGIWAPPATKSNLDVFMPKGDCPKEAFYLVNGRVQPTSEYKGDVDLARLIARRDELLEERDRLLAKKRKMQARALIEQKQQNPAKITEEEKQADTWSRVERALISLTNSVNNLVKKQETQNEPVVNYSRWLKWGVVIAIILAVILISLAAIIAFIRSLRRKENKPPRVVG